MILVLKLPKEAVRDIPPPLKPFVKHYPRKPGVYLVLDVTDETTPRTPFVIGEAPVTVSWFSTEIDAYSAIAAAWDLPLQIVEVKK